MYSFVTKGMSTFRSKLKGQVLKDGSVDEGGELLNEVIMLKPPRVLNLCCADLLKEMSLSKMSHVNTSMVEVTSR